MEPARPLREVFADLAGHDDGRPAGLAGHEGLPEDLLIRAIGSYADTAPAEVAEHLSAFVATPSDAGAGLHLLAVAPVGEWDGEVALDGEPALDGDPAPDGEPEAHDVELSSAHGFDLDGLEHADTLDTIGHDPAPVTAHDAYHDAAHDADPGFGHSLADEAPHPGPVLDDSDFGHSDFGHATGVPAEDDSSGSLDEHAEFEDHESAGPDLDHDDLDHDDLDHDDLDHNDLDHDDLDHH